MSTGRTADCEIAVVGAGVVGCAVALALARRGRLRARAGALGAVAPRAGADLLSRVRDRADLPGTVAHTLARRRGVICPRRRELRRASGGRGGEDGRRRLL